MTMSTIPNIIYVDVRPLQDPDYRFRGVGQHSTSLLTALRQYNWQGNRPKMIALTTPSLEALYPEHSRFFDSIQTGNWRATDKNSWFITLSPMTHDPLTASTLLLDPDIFKIALFYDLIQLQFPNRYLHTASLRTTFLNAFSWLEHYDAFASISHDTGKDLIKYRNINPSYVFVSGVAVRRSLEPPDGEVPLSRSERKHILVAGGGDPRKNPECALLAHAQAQECQDIPIYVFGNYPPEYKEAFRKQFADNGGENKRLFFPQHLDDSGLRQLYRQAIMTIVPSRAEGFSIPIIESSAAGTPVAVSAVGAHPELIPDKSLQFGPDDPEALAEIMRKLVRDNDEWAQRRDAIIPLWKNYTMEDVGRRFMEGTIALQKKHKPMEAPAVIRHARPQLAILTPLPPSESGVADYSYATLTPLARHADLHIFTDSTGIDVKPEYSSVSPVRMAPYSSKKFDHRLSVLGNSSFHTTAFNYLMEFGGAALAHDARMINFYALELGFDRALRVANAELGNAVSMDELHMWLHHQENLPILFLSEIARAASPLIVHSPVTAQKINDLYGVEPKLLPFAQYRPMPIEMLQRSVRRERRESLGWQTDEFVITSFGFVAADKAPLVLIWAIKMLRTWNVKARLVLCGDVSSDMSQHINWLIAHLDLADAVTLFDFRTTEQTYIDHLIATDAAIQLRTYFMGGLSGALNDCIAAGIPTVANDHLAKSSLAPPFVRRVNDDLSPILIAEAFLDIIASGDHLDRPIDMTRAFAADHSLEKYAELMMESLGFDIAKGR